MVDGVLFVNTGSVGRPKDGDWRTGYVVLTLDDEIAVEFRRLDYDVERAAAAILSSSLPDEFAAFLRAGGS
jgi:diadenosine tetraphosphatase ApaH/serine/threonine PP2A family protein phosphatase